MAESAAWPPLRLVGDRPPAQPNPADLVAMENRLAAGNTELDPRDPRWAFAMRTRSQLQGMVLTPERREQLLREAKTMNLRPFDASVIIAIVQDGARRGDSNTRLATSLALVRPAQRAAVDYGWRWALALISALIVNFFLINWFTG